MSTVVHTYTANTTYTASAVLYYGTTDDNGNPAATVNVEVIGAPGHGTLWMGFGADIKGDVPMTALDTLECIVNDAHHGGAGDGPGTAGGNSSAVVNSASKLLIEAGGGGGIGSQGFGAPNGGGNADIGQGADDGIDFTGKCGPGKGADDTTPGKGGAGKLYTGGDGTSFAGSYTSVDGGVATGTSDAGGGGGGLAGGGSGGGGPTGGAGGGGGSSFVDDSVTNVVYAIASTGPLTPSTPAIIVTEVIVDPPDTPLAVMPDDGSFVDVNLAITLQWDYIPGVTDGGYSAYALFMSASVTSISGYWNGTDFSSGSPVWMPDTGGAMTIPESMLTAGVTYTWNVQTQEGSYLQEGPASADQTFVGSTGPTATSITPTGTVTDSQPNITFILQLDDVSVLEEYQVIIYTAAQQSVPGFTPGESPSTWDSGPLDGGNQQIGAEIGLTCGAILATGVTYYMYVLLTETGSVEGPWESVTFDVSYSAPSAPTLAVTNQIDVTTGLPYNRCVITRTEGGSPAHVILQYSDDNVNWLNVRGADFLSGSLTVPDYEAYPNTIRHYRVFVVIGNSGSYVMSPSSASVACTNVVPDWWLIDVETMSAEGITAGHGVVGAAIPLNVMADSLPIVISEVQGQHDVLGGEFTVIIRDVIKGQDVTFTVDFLDQATFNEFIALRNLQKTLLLQAPYIAQWFMAFDSDLTPTVTNAAGVYQQVGFGLIEQARP